MAPGTIGMTASRIRKPRPCSASQACTPPPASSPNAEPPESAMASIRSTVLARSSSALLAGAGSAAAHVDRGDRRLVEHDGGDAGGERRIVGVADADAGNIGEEIFQEADSRPAASFVHQGYISRGKCFNRPAPSRIILARSAASPVGSKETQRDRCLVAYMQALMIL